MELKNIITKLNTNKETKKETFLALEISYEAVKSAVWTVEEEKTVVLKTGSIEEWEEKNEDKSLINAVDVSITNASEGIEPEPNKVIFGLPEGWVRGEKISESKKEILKELCSKLELQPLGFVVALEALVAYLKKKEGAPVSAIFINLSETQSAISLVRLGKIKGSQIVGRSDDLAADIREGLARFGHLDDLPTRMILFNGLVDFEEAKQQLISFDWQEQLPFLHFPKVETLEVSVLIKAVAIAGGAEVAKSLGFEIKEEDKKEKEEGKEKEEKEEKEEEKEKEEKEEEEEIKVVATDLGFAQDKDITEVEPAKKEKEKPSITAPFLKDKERIERLGKVGRIEKKSFLADIPGKLVNFSAFFKKIPFRLPKFPTKKGPFLIILSIVFLILFSLAGLAFYWYVPKATVTLYFEPKVLEEELEIIIDAQAEEVDKDRGIIPGSLKEIEVEGSKTTGTTGEKLVGDKAKGEVIVYNKTDLAKTFSKETILIGPDKLSFSLDEEVKVASKSAQETVEGEQVTYGKATVSITAVSIGAEANLSSGTQLSFKEYPSSLYSAKTENGLSGGSSRQIKAVAEEDQSSLLEDLTVELKTKAQQDLKIQISSTEEVLEREIDSEILNQKFSAQEDEEVDNLSLDLRIKFTFLAYQKEKFEELLKERFSDNIPSDFVFESKIYEIDIKDISFEDDKAEIEAIVEANLLPQLDIEEIKKNLKGRYPEVTESYLESLANFSRADIKISPRLPAKLRTLPRLIKNIKVEIKIEE